MIDAMEVAELQRLIEYKFAPEPLLAVQGLANTYSFDDGEEEELLGDPEASRGWLVRTGLGEPRIAVTPAEHRRLVDVRAVLRSLIEANLEGEVADTDVKALARFAADHPVALVVDDSGRLALDLEPASSVDGVISRMIGITQQAQRGGEWQRLKICASDECRWAFYDTSRNRGGTWCQMEVCGNKIKNRAYRKRRAGA